MKPGEPVTGEARVDATRAELYADWAGKTNQFGVIADDKKETPEDT